MDAPPGSAAARPHALVDGRRSLGPDEDLFTLAAEALDQVLGPLAGPGVRELRISGGLPASADEIVTRLVGGPRETRRFDGVEAALAGLGSAVPGGPIVVVHVGAGPQDGPEAPTALAARFAGTATGPDESESSLRQAARARPRAEENRIEGVLPIDRSAIERISRLSLGAVSEGAYVPRARYLEEIPSRWRFEGDECLACRTLSFPQRGRCRHCARTDRLRPRAFPLHGGTIVAATEIGPGGQPTEFDPWVEAVGSYGVLLIELAPGIRATVPTTDGPPKAFEIGRTVSTFLRRLYPMEGEWRYGRKAAPP